MANNIYLGNTVIGSSIQEAPMDGSQYVRQDGSWIEVPAGFIAQDSEPIDTDVLWIDTDDDNADVNNTISVDAYMSDTSTNPVQNQVVKGYIDGLFQVVTEAEYEALGDVVNTNGVFYFITE